MKAIFLSLMLVTISAEAATFTVNTKIQKIRTMSEFNPVAAARNHVPFQVAGPLEGGCAWLYITSAAKDSYALLLAAKLADKTIGIHYSNTPSPWHKGTCQVNHLDLD